MAKTVTIPPSDQQATPLAPARRQPRPGDKELREIANTMGRRAAREDHEREKAAQPEPTGDES